MCEYAAFERVRQRSRHSRGRGYGADIRTFYAKKSLGRSGTGLGLTIVWNTMQDHNGYIDLQTGADGTRFLLYFPVNRETVKISLRGFLRISSEAQVGRSWWWTIRRFSACLSARCSPVWVSKPHPPPAGRGDCLSQNQSGGPRDSRYDNGSRHQRPGTYERIIQFRPDQKAIIASGYSLNDDVRAAQRMGAGAFLKKPYGLKELELAVRKELAGAD